MLNITTITNGFILNQTQYTFEGQIEIISESQCHVPTDKGIILSDLSCTINEIEFTNINVFVKALKEE
jgi:hypothetical protein